MMCASMNCRGDSDWGGCSDIVTVAAPGTAWPPELAAAIDALKSELSRQRVEVRRMLLQGACHERG